MKNRSKLINELEILRREVSLYEMTIEERKRKRLGQFFTGMQLARLLAALATKKQFATVIDPMAGTGDLLDAVIERSELIGGTIEQIDAIEIDRNIAEECGRRLALWHNIQPRLRNEIYITSAFDVAWHNERPSIGYDLVITNPPYVRYQAVSRSRLEMQKQSSMDIRNALIEIIRARAPQKERVVWETLARGFSGLSDLSVPSWLLSALMVKPGGVLAIVAPATWRTRDYADVLLYLLSRFFSLKTVVADQQPGWFSEALVRTHLVIATRLSTDDACVPLIERSKSEDTYTWVEIDSSAATEGSLVGAAFPSNDPEIEFAAWLLKPVNPFSNEPLGTLFKKRRQDEETAITLGRCKSSAWFPLIERAPTCPQISIFDIETKNIITDDIVLPHAIRDIIGFNPHGLIYLDQDGIKVGQGLRTGCNDFFYVDLIEDTDVNNAVIRTSKLFGSMLLEVPKTVLQPVLRRQFELTSFKSNLSLSGFALDLRQFVLPEDYEDVKLAKSVFSRFRIKMPNVMPTDLANHVRRAANTQLGRYRDGQYISNLSAVKTNVRLAAESIPRSKIPRYWYMLPDFARRHRPDVFVPRINQRTPQAVSNAAAPILIDANFSTIWTENKKYSPQTITRILNSCWSRAYMEAIGTQMGGGALKLEATQLRRLPIPLLNDEYIKRITHLSESDPTTSQRVDEIVISSMLDAVDTQMSLAEVIQSLHEFIALTSQSRQRPINAR